MYAAWDNSLAENIVKPIVLKRFRMGRFDQFFELSKEDVAQELIRWALAEFHKFDPAKATFSTWLTMFATARIHNLHRDRSRQGVREGRYASTTEYRRDGDGNRVPVVYPEEVIDPADPEPETVEGEIVGGAGDLLLADWLHTVYIHARRITATQKQQGWTYERAQAIAVGFLIRKLGISTRGARGLFEDRVDLCRVVGFPPLPSRMWFARASDVSRN